VADVDVDLVVLDQGIDTSTAIGRMFFQALGAIAEHALMSERTTRQARIAQQMYDETGPDGKRRYTVAQIAAEFGVTRPTIYRHLKLPGIKWMDDQDALPADRTTSLAPRRPRRVCPRSGDH
jgi:DNA invertase Pin-like site-specific DNA recombinase